MGFWPEDRLSGEVPGSRCDVAPELVRQPQERVQAGFSVLGVGHGRTWLGLKDGRKSLFRTVGRYETSHIAPPSTNRSV